MFGGIGYLPEVNRIELFFGLAFVALKSIKLIPYLTNLR
jgi:hypothetical protein